MAEGTKRGKRRPSSAAGGAAEPEDAKSGLARDDGSAEEGNGERVVVAASTRWLAVAAAWLVPGAGHWILGRRHRGVLFLVLVSISIALGVWLGGNLYRFELPGPLVMLATLASMGMGLPYFVLRFVSGFMGDPTAAGFEYGKAFLLGAGLMNLLLVLDTWDIAVGRKE